MNTIEKQILKETKGLPSNVMNEILDFIQFIKEKKLKTSITKTNKDGLNLELSIMDRSELEHLEEEFKDYRDIYPHE